MDDERVYGRPGNRHMGRAGPLRGRFRVVHYDRQTRTATEESIPYAVAGEEDVGKEFILSLSDAFLRLLDESLERAPGSLPAPAPRRAAGDGANGSLTQSAYGLIARLEMRTSSIRPDQKVPGARVQPAPMYRPGSSQSGRAV